MGRPAICDSPFVETFLGQAPQEGRATPLNARRDLNIMCNEYFA